MVLRETTKTKTLTQIKTMENIFEKFDNQDTVSITLNDKVRMVEEPTQSVRVSTIERVPNKKMVRMPRESKDHRVRAWSHEEKHLAVKLYLLGKSRNSIAKLLGVSHAPLMRMLAYEGVLKAQHLNAAQRLGYI